MFMLTETGSFEQEIRKSRFIAFAGPVEDEAAAKAFVAAHADAAATHNAYAYRIGPSVRFFDDGEVGGTAGKPILQVIEGNALDHVVVLVTRYYGGVLLGTGGLVRAYGGTAGQCLKTLAKGPIIKRSRFTVAADFQDMAQIRSRLMSVPGLGLDGESFHASGSLLSLSIPESGLSALLDLIRDLSRGRAEVKIES